MYPPMPQTLLELKKKDETITKAHEIIRRMASEKISLQKEKENLSVELDKTSRKKREQKKRCEKSKLELIELTHSN